MRMEVPVAPCQQYVYDWIVSDGRLGKQNWNSGTV